MSLETTLDTRGGGTLAWLRFAAVGAAKLLSRNLLIYGLGGLVAPFIGIKLIDMIVSGLGFA